MGAHVAAGCLQAVMSLTHVELVAVVQQARREYLQSRSIKPTASFEDIHPQFQEASDDAGEAINARGGSYTGGYATKYHALVKLRRNEEVLSVCSAALLAIPDLTELTIEWCRQGLEVFERLLRLIRAPSSVLEQARSIADKLAPVIGVPKVGAQAEKKTKKAKQEKKKHEDEDDDDDDDEKTKQEKVQVNQVNKVNQKKEETNEKNKDDEEIKEGEVKNHAAQLALEKAKMFAGSRDFSNAVHWVGRAIESTQKKSTLADLFALRASYRFRLNLYEIARKDAEQALSCDQSNVEACRWLCESHVKLRREKETRSACLRGLKYNPVHARLKEL
ncbi:hypothetical protein Poli38472_001145 [Pythium oligandrum]|uniref:Uncharacterized protein n=1 Tax=Pythium oligandrum TaxID=41045 RepID=A0A8K1CTJ7_PYTOL|nr:hypothetical protein Poli38472_001145 [Pythium oligandrum]|eukprot:TMW68989.1 hypothetical protein Poli38472_001145 [Pythium oligandrum]